MDKLTLEGLMEMFNNYEANHTTTPAFGRIRDYASRLIAQSAQEALDAPVQEPGALDSLDWERLMSGQRRALDPAHQDIFDRLAAAPVQPAAPQPLTIDQIRALWIPAWESGDFLIHLVRAIEAAHGITHKAREDADGVKPSQAQSNDTGAKMPCGAVVRNVYEAYEAGKRAAGVKPLDGEQR